jgi:DNA-directed RNA polymerase specialized sigma subunit
VLGKVAGNEGIDFEPVEREDALQVLAIALWKTAQKYDSRSHVRFRVYAYLELYNDAIDHFRAERGRHGQHRVHDPGDRSPTSVTSLLTLIDWTALPAETRRRSRRLGR